MINFAEIEIPIIWASLSFLIYSLFFIWVLGKIEKKFNEKNKRIKELEEELFSKDNILEENITKQENEKDFIDKILNNSKKFNEKFESKIKKENESNIQKGKNFEWQIYNHFNNLGYQVENRSAKYKKYDAGIDILAKKEDIYYLIQCKNFSPTTKIKHKLIKEFNSNCIDFINKNSNKLNNENTKFLFIISNYESLEKCALHYINDNNNKCEYMEIKYNS
jgi:hypothetical protein